MATYVNPCKSSSTRPIYLLCHSCLADMCVHREGQRDNIVVDLFLPRPLPNCKFHGRDKVWIVHCIVSINGKLLMSAWLLDLSFLPVRDQPVHTLGANNRLHSLLTFPTAVIYLATINQPGKSRDISVTDNWNISRERERERETRVSFAQCGITMHYT